MMSPAGSFIDTPFKNTIHCHFQSSAVIWGSDLLSFAVSFQSNVCPGGVRSCALLLFQHAALDKMNGQNGAPARRAHQTTAVLKISGRGAM